MKDKAQFTGFNSVPKPRHLLVMVLLGGREHPGKNLNILRKTQTATAYYSNNLDKE